MPTESAFRHRDHNAALFDDRFQLDASTMLFTVHRAADGVEVEIARPTVGAL